MGTRSTGSHPTTTQADGHLLEYFRDTFSGGGGGAVAPGVSPPGGPSGIVASGGVISDYEDVDSPGTKYRAHFFGATGSFNVTSIGDYGNTVEYVVIAGGGGGSGYWGNPTNPGYAIGSQGSASNFDNGGPNPISCVGGGTGGCYEVSSDSVRPGGSGGGGAAPNSAPTAPSQSGGNGTANQGHNGGTGYWNPPNHWKGAGGGGAGGTGYDHGPHPGGGVKNGTEGMGGAGLYTKALTGSKLGFAGGGSGGGRRYYENFGYDNFGVDGPYGGGIGGSDRRGQDAVQNTGSGGGGGDSIGAGGGGGGAGGYRSSITGESSGGGGSAESAFTVSGGQNYTVTVGAGGAGSAATPAGTYAQGGGGSGASGCVIVRYEINNAISEVPSGSATGGYKYSWVAPGASSVGDGSGSVTVHVFTTSGKFSTGPTFNKICEYFVVAGGGGGGVGGLQEGGGGGGAGGVLRGVTTIGNNESISVTVGSGGNRAKCSSSGPALTHATNGGNSVFAAPTGSITAYGGGKGCNGQSISPSGNDPAFSGGSGGGRGAIDNTVIGYGLNPTTPSPAISSDYPGESYPYGSVQGYNGGAYAGSPAYQGGGGGGAGGVGYDGGTPAGTYGNGGVGLRAPVTFQNPAQPAFGKGYDGPDGGGGVQSDYWFAGGGGGGAWNSPVPSGGKGGGAGPNKEGFAGGGDGGSANGSNPGSVGGVSSGRMFSGGGGGGSASGTDSGTGGPGIVMIAYLTD